MGVPLLPGTIVLRRPGGAPLGTIGRLYVHPSLKTLVACSVQRRGRFFAHGRAFLVATTDLRAVGPGTVALVPDARWPLAEDDGAWRTGLLDVDELFDRPVVSENGVSLGRVSALAFSPGTHRLQRIEVASTASPVPGIVWGDEVHTLNTGRVVVADAVLAPAPPSALRHAA